MARPRPQPRDQQQQCSCSQASIQGAIRIPVNPSRKNPLVNSGEYDGGDDMTQGGRNWRRTDKAEMQTFLRFFEFFLSLAFHRHKIHLFFVTQFSKILSFFNGGRDGRLDSTQSKYTKPESCGKSVYIHRELLSQLKFHFIRCLLLRVWVAPAHTNTPKTQIPNW